MSLSELQHKIDTQSAVIAQIGLGYVGLPVACMFAQAGFEVVGVDVVAERVAMLSRGENPIEGIEPNLAELIQEVVSSGKLRVTTPIEDAQHADIFIIAVQTPVDDSDHKPRYQHMRTALAALGQVMKEGALVIVESTLAPTTLQKVIIPALEEASGKQAGCDFYVGHCPERVMPGRLLHNIRTMDRVAGAQSPEIGAVMVALYKHIVQGTLDVTDLLTAELVKTTENAYRDVQIAFANEMARICDEVGGDVWRLRELVNKSPGRNMLLPGAGVGGHCIPKDPYLLISNVTTETPLIRTARQVNRGMPSFVLQMVERSLQAHGKTLAGATLAVLGYSYLENSDDTRDTPSQYFVAEAEQHGAEVKIHDPFVPSYKGDVRDVVRGADAIVILVAHNEYKTLDWASLVNTLRTRIIVDARRVLPPNLQIEGAHIEVIGIGNG
jgi:UDP-N-acetyl-D-mannosaminuronic acid dehydrogenase